MSWGRGVTPRRGLDERRRDSLSRDHLSGGVAQSAARGVLDVLLGQLGRFGLQIASVAILSRLLDPSAFGLIAMTTAIIGLVDLLRDMGLSTAALQSKHLSHSQVNVLFWLQSFSGLVLFVLVALSAPLIASFYQQPALVWVVPALATAFVFSGITALHQAVIERRLQFRVLAVATVTSTATALVAAIIVALNGGGYWALVVLNVGQPLMLMVILWTRSGWLPGRPRWDATAPDLIKVGADVLGFNLLNYIGRNADSVIIGKFHGATSLGLYDRAFRLVTLPLQQVNAPISRVAVPTLSMLREESDRLRRFYLTALSGMTLVAAPMLAILVVLADPIVHVVLGGNWLGAVELFRVLAIVGIVQTVSQSNGWLYVATRRTRAQLLFAAVARPLVVVAMLIGSAWGPMGVAVGNVVASLVLLLPGSWWCTRGTPVRLRDLVAAAWPAFTLSAVIGVLGWALMFVTEGPTGPTVTGSLAQGLVVGLAIGCLYVGALRFWPPARTRILPLLTALRGRSTAVADAGKGPNGPGTETGPVQSPVGKEHR